MVGIVSSVGSLHCPRQCNYFQRGPRCKINQISIKIICNKETHKDKILIVSDKGIRYFTF